MPRGYISQDRPSLSGTLECWQLLYSLPIGAKDHIAIPSLPKAPCRREQVAFCISFSKQPSSPKQQVSTRFQEMRTSLLDLAVATILSRGTSFFLHLGLCTASETCQSGILLCGNYDSCFQKLWSKTASVQVTSLFKGASSGSSRSLSGLSMSPLQTSSSDFSWPLQTKIQRPR